MSAQALAAGLPDGLYPLQHYLSPPVFFVLGGLLMALFGTSDYVMLCLSAGFGTLTAPLVFLLGRQWNGRAAGASAGLLVALSGFHVTFSRVGADRRHVLVLLLGGVVPLHAGRRTRE